MNQAADNLRRWRERPDVMVRELFGATPDPWQEEGLRAFPTTPRLAMKASKGPGKTAKLAWLGWNFLLTRKDPNIAATSISGDNLRDGLWKEMAYWRSKAPLLEHLFEMTSERIFLKDSPQTWFMTARTWSKSANQEELGNTLAGLHADNILFLIDESGGMPVAILAAAEAALASCKEGHIVQAGNTNSLDGALYVACVKQANLWKVIVITGDPDDPKRSPRINVDWARDMIKAYGRDSLFVKIMVLGEWPDASFNALLSANDVERAMGQKYQQWDIDASPRILGVDVARGGLAKSVIFPRQGLVAFKPHVMRNVNSVQGAGKVARVWEDWDVDACFIDNTGGFGAGWVDQLEVLNRNPIGIGFAEQAEEPKLYANRRTEMHFRLAEWIKKGGALPNCPELVMQLPAIKFKFKGDRMILIDKELIEAEIGTTLDESDSLALTFAATVAPRVRQPKIPMRAEPENYDPYRDLMRA